MQGGGTMETLPALFTAGLWGEVSPDSLSAQCSPRLPWLR